MPTIRPWSWAPQIKTRLKAKFPPLRVIFCGSDAFSIPSFHMLRELHLRRSDIISALSIVTPADRPSGRGLKVLKPAPMTLLARQMGWTCSHAQSFHYTADEMPIGQWDLIVAVSFGHKIDAEVLQRCSAGGLNVHPSRLPKYRGPAPLHHTLLNGDNSTEICVQTIHPHEFDKGEVIARSVSVEILPETTLTSLTSQTAQIGAQLLREVLVAGYPGNASVKSNNGETPSYAPKIEKAETQVQWWYHDRNRIVRWHKVMGSLWTSLDGKVVKLYGLKASTHHEDAIPGSIRSTSSILLARASDGWISIDNFTIAGKTNRDGKAASELDGKMFGT